MKTRTAISGLILVAATIGVAGPVPTPASAQCDPDPAGVDDGTNVATGTSSCSNNCEKLAEAVRKITRADLLACTQ